MPCYVSREPYCSTCTPTDLNQYLKVIAKYLPRFGAIEAFGVVSWTELLVNKLVLKDGRRRNRRKLGRFGAERERHALLHATHQPPWEEKKVKKT